MLWGLHNSVRRGETGIAASFSEPHLGQGCSEVWYRVMIASTPEPHHGCNFGGM